ncbi:hypothetical protein HK096_003654, partial [Nowakowskiella sp. JEL0078]
MWNVFAISKPQNPMNAPQQNNFAKIPGDPGEIAEAIQVSDLKLATGSGVVFDSHRQILSQKKSKYQEAEASITYNTSQTLTRSHNTNTLTTDLYNAGKNSDHKNYRLGWFENKRTETVEESIVQKPSTRNNKFGESTQIEINLTRSTSLKNNSRSKNSQLS